MKYMTLRLNLLFVLATGILGTLSGCSSMQKKEPEPSRTNIEKTHEPVAPAPVERKEAS